MPYYYNTEQASNKSQAAIEINRMLEKDVSNVNKHHHALEMDLVDIHSLVNDIVVDPFIFNYKYATTSIITDCVQSGEPCSSSDEYIWWDDTHFSTGKYICEDEF
jgi:phospholipase/lecithinase/hemolysin